MKKPAILCMNQFTLFTGRILPPSYVGPATNFFVVVSATCGILFFACYGSSLNAQNSAKRVPQPGSSSEPLDSESSQVGKNNARISDVVYTAATFSVDGRHVVLGSQAGIEVRSWPGMEQTESIATSLEHVLDLSFSPDGRTLLIAGGSPAENGVIEVLDWDSRTNRASVAGHGDVVYQVAWSQDGQTWAAASADSRCSVFEAGTHVTRATFSGHSQSVLGLSWLGEGQQIASVSSDQTVRLWDSTTGRLLRTLDNHVGSVTRVALRPNIGKPAPDVMASISDDRTVRFWQPAVGRLIRFAKLDSIPHALIWSKDGAQLYVGCDDGGVRAINFDDAAVEPPMALLSGAVLELHFCPDAKHLLATGYGGFHVVGTQKQ